MNITAALAEIHRFWPAVLPVAPAPSGAAARLQAEFDYPLPADLATYLDTVAPAHDVQLEAVGNPLRLYGLASLGQRQPGYSWNPITRQPLPDWPPTFFLLADEGADPVVLDLARPADGIQKLWHGTGSWDAGDAVADTLGQFLLCSAALHHALQAFEHEPIIDDERGFNLAPRAAAWLFPRLKTWAGDHYAEWASVFDNS